MMTMPAANKRKQLQKFTWLGLPLVIAWGWLQPVAGFLLFGCMAGALLVAVKNGRNWCDWMCPRGAFFDFLFTRVSPGRKIPAFFRHKTTKMVMILTIFTVIGVQFYLSWGDLNAMGTALVRILTVTTVLGIILALFIHPRTWCHICPVGTVSGWISRGKKPLYVHEGCSSCGLCARVCPMQLEPHRHKDDGVMAGGECLRCNTCVQSCPRRALSLAEDKERKAA